MEKIAGDPGLPRVLLLGDSITMGYASPLRKLLARKVNLHRPFENCRSTEYSLPRLDSWLRSFDRWDVIHFNWGLHDIILEKSVMIKIVTLLFFRQEKVEKYKKNLVILVERMKETGAKLIWGPTTPVPQGAKNRRSGDELFYNREARKIMETRGVTINDLYSAVVSSATPLQRPGNVHFTPLGYDELAKEVSQSILVALKTSAP